MGSSYIVINDIKLLRKFKKLNLVQFCPQTGTKIRALYDKKLFTCTYIDEAKPFVYEDETYMEKYFDGCFYPYLIKIIP